MVEAAIALLVGVFEVTSLVVLAFTSAVVVASVVTAAVVSEDEGGCCFLVAEVMLPSCVVFVTAAARLCHTNGGCESFDHRCPSPKYDYWVFFGPIF